MLETDKSKWEAFFLIQPVLRSKDAAVELQMEGMGWAGTNIYFITIILFVGVSGSG